MDFLPWIVFIHVVGAFLFAAGHGVSLAVAFRLRADRDPTRLGALLDLSGWSLGIAFAGLLVLLVSGIAAGLMSGAFARGWIWLSLALLIVVGGLMTPLGAKHFGAIRRALGQRTRDLKADDATPDPASPTELAALLDTRRPEALTVIGAAGFLAILWLMMFRPF
jgi:uncharacterized membrane protein